MKAFCKGPAGRRGLFCTRKIPDPHFWKKLLLFKGSVLAVLRESHGFQTCGHQEKMELWWQDEGFPNVHIVIGNKIDFITGLGRFTVDVFHEFDFDKGILRKRHGLTGKTA